MILILSFSNQGFQVSESLSHEFSDCIVKPRNITGKVFLEEYWDRAEKILFISSVGLALRLISPHLKSKEVDPAVVVMDECQTFAVSVLSGHLGGANEFAKEISFLTGSQAVITTATDCNHLIAIDVFSTEMNLIIDETYKILKVSKKQLETGKILIKCDEKWNLPSGYKRVEEGYDVIISDKKISDTALVLLEKVYHLGIGCRKDTDEFELEKTLLQYLDEKQIDVRQIKKMHSIDLKKDESAIRVFSEKYDIPFATYSKEELMMIKEVSSRSEFVQRITGVDNVCERSALMESTELVYPKENYHIATFALGKEKK